MIFRSKDVVVDQALPRPTNKKSVWLFNIVAASRVKRGAYGYVVPQLFTLLALDLRHRWPTFPDTATHIGTTAATV